MVQIAVRLSKNEQKLMSRVPQESGDVRDLDQMPTPEARWYWAGDPITLKSTQFISNAIREASKGQITVKSFGWSRIRSIDRNNPLNYKRERRTFMVSEETKKMLENLQLRENFETLTDTLIWCMYNYSEYLRIHGLPLAAQPKRRYVNADYHMVTIRVKNDDFDEFTKVAEENQRNVGRVIHDYLQAMITNEGIHGVFGRLYGATDNFTQHEPVADDESDGNPLSQDDDFFEDFEG